MLYYLLILYYCAGIIIGQLSLAFLCSKQIILRSSTGLPIIHQSIRQSAHKQVHSCIDRIKQQIIINWLAIKLSFNHLYSNRLICFTILQLFSLTPTRNIIQYGIYSPIIELTIVNNKPKHYFTRNLNAPRSMFLTTYLRIYSRQDSQFITYTSKIYTYYPYSSFLLSFKYRYPSFYCRHYALTGLSTMMSFLIVEQVVAVQRLICLCDASLTTWSIDCILGSLSSMWYLILTMRVMRLQQIQVFSISICRQMQVGVLRCLVTLCLIGVQSRVMAVCSSISGGFDLGCSMWQQKRKPNSGCFNIVGLTETFTSSWELKESYETGRQEQAFSLSYFQSRMGRSRICQLYDRIIQFGLYNWCDSQHIELSKVMIQLFIMIILIVMCRG